MLLELSYSSKGSIMRILIAGFNLESVTFLPNPTTLDEFERVAKRGEDLLSSFEDTNTVPGGFIKACKDEGVELVPLVYSDCLLYTSPSPRDH